MRTGHSCAAVSGDDSLVRSVSMSCARTANRFRAGEGVGEGETAAWLTLPLTGNASVRLVLLLLLGSVHGFEYGEEKEDDSSMGSQWQIEAMQVSTNPESEHPSASPHSRLIV